MSEMLSELFLCCKYPLIVSSRDNGQLKGTFPLLSISLTHFPSPNRQTPFPCLSSALQGAVNAKHQVDEVLSRGRGRSEHIA